jgi:hypothetical protein
MPSKHPSQPAASVDEQVADRSKNSDVLESPELGPPPYDEDESPTASARRRSPKYLKVLVPGAGCVVRVFDDE